MSNTNCLNAKGQIVIPHALRKRLGLVPGTPITFREEKGSIVLLKGSDDPLDRLWGRWKRKGRSLPRGVNVDEFVEALRGR